MVGDMQHPISNLVTEIYKKRQSSEQIALDEKTPRL